MTENHKSGMTLIVKAISRLTVGLSLVYGMYIVLHGHISPGGGFAGGLIIALAFVQIMLAFGRSAAANRLSGKLAANLESVGALFFLAIALLGFLGGAFFTNILGKGTPFELFSAGTIPLSNIAIGIKVAVGLFAIFMAFVILERAKRKV